MTNAIMDMDVSLLILAFVCLSLILALVLFIFGKKLRKPTEIKRLIRLKDVLKLTRDSTVISNWFNDVLLWILAKNETNNKALFVPAWIESLNEYSFKTDTDITIKFESIDRREIIPETKKIVVENESSLQSLKLKIDLKIQAISFKIGVRHSTDTDSEFAPFLAFAPFIEGNVTVSVNYEQDPAKVQICFTSPPKMDLKLTFLEASVNPFDSEGVIIPLLKQIISSSTISIPIAATNVTIWQHLAAGFLQPNKKNDRVKRQSLLAARSFDMTKFDTLLLRNIALTSAPGTKLAGNLCCAVSMTMPNQKMLTTTLPATGGRLQWPDDLELKVDSLSPEVSFEILDQSPSDQDQEQVIGMAMLAFDDVTSVRAQQHTLHVIPCGDCSLVGLALSFSLSLQAKTTPSFLPSAPTAAAEHQVEMTAKLDSISPKRSIRTVKRVGTDGITVTATTVTTEKPAGAIYDSLLPQTPMQVEKVEEEHALLDVPRVESHRPQVPGVTELVVHDLLTQPSVVVPHKSSNQKRLAYTITVTSVQKEPTLAELQQEADEQQDQFNTHPGHDRDLAGSNAFAANNKRPTKLVRTLKKHFSFGRKHHMVITRRHSSSAGDVRINSSDHGGLYNSPEEEHVGFIGDNSINNFTEKTKKKSISSSFRNLFRKKRDKSLNSSHDITADNILVKSSALPVLGVSRGPSNASQIPEYESATFPRQKKKNNTRLA